MSLYDVAVPTFKRTLTSLDAILTKAEAHAAANKIDPAVLVNARLYPDMHPLKRQVQIATDSAKRGAGLLAGVDIPVFEDNEETFKQLHARIKKTISFLNKLKKSQFEDAETKTITLPLGGTSMKFDGTTFLMSFAMPNFSFHVVTAYNILRHNGVQIGKRDYLGAA
ncbi:MAG: DUF1993 domain-containing protein [Proteobacteria bacterium]|nr:DUF1993 domain-containing protein [Pseudomonadota bacterium]